MSYGRYFLGEDYVPPQPDIGKVHAKLVEDEIRSGILPPNPVKHRRLQQSGRLFATGVESVLAQECAQILPRTKSSTQGSSSNVQKSTINILEERAVSPTPRPQRATLLSDILREASALRSPPVQDDRFMQRLQGAPSSSVFNMSTPKLWPQETERTSFHGRTVGTTQPSASPFISDHTCSKSSINLSDTVTHKCRRMERSSALKEEKLALETKNAARLHRKRMDSHVRWLAFPIQGHEEQASRTLSQMKSSSSAKFVCTTLQKASQLERQERGDQATASTVQEETQQDLTFNTFRHRSNRARSMRYCRSVPSVIRQKDPLDYKDDIYVKPMTRFNACLRPNPDYKLTPSYREVTEAVDKLTRKQILFFHARVLEMGALVRALRSANNSQTGFEVVLSLHRACIKCAEVNVQPFVLSKSQLFEVISRRLTWLPQDSLGRLLLSFDNTNTGMIRYIRIFSAAMACLDSAVLSLSANLQRVDRAFLSQYVEFDMYRSKDSKFSSSKDPSKFGQPTTLHSSVRQQGADHHEKPLHESEWRKMRGEVALIQVLHQLYSECRGFSFEKAGSEASSSDISTMPLEDIVELFSCCIGSTDDEAKMDMLCDDLVQYIFDQLGSRPPGQTLSAKTVLKHGELRALFPNLFVSFPVLLDATLRHPQVLREFVRQVESYRASIKPFLTQSNLSMDDAIAHYAEKQRS